MIINTIFLIILLISVIFVAFSTNYIANIIILNVFSLVMTLLYLVMHAPDVAITEASIGACITTIFFLWTLMFLKKKNADFSDQTYIKVQYIKNTSIVILLFVFSAVIMYALSDLPIYGEYNSPINNDIYHYYIEGTWKYFNFPNIVTAILAGFRGYDTLGETSVIFTAGVTVNLLLKKD